MDLEAKKLFEKERFAQELGVKLSEAHNGYARLEVKVKPQFANLHGFAYGSLFFLWLTLFFALSINMEELATAVQFRLAFFVLCLLVMSSLVNLYKFIGENRRQ